MELIYAHEQRSPGIGMALREIYYTLKHVYPTQAAVQTGLRKVCGMTGLSQDVLGVFPMAKGLLAGCVSVACGAQGKRRRSADSSQTLVDARVDPWSINAHSVMPGAVQLEFIQQPEFVLVVEKETVFRRLVAERIWELVPCVLITGRGQPDHATRAVLHQIVQIIPKQTQVVGLVDYNPYGVRILATYRFGASAPPGSARSDAGISKLGWLGLHARDIAALPASTGAKQAMTQVDVRACAALLTGPQLAEAPLWQGEVDTMTQLGCKVELDSIAHAGMHASMAEFVVEKLAAGLVIW